MTANGLILMLYALLIIIAAISPSQCSIKIEGNEKLDTWWKRAIFTTIATSPFFFILWVASKAIAAHR